MNKRTNLIFISIVWCCFCLDASGQTRCPVGVQAGSSQCLPDDEDAAPARPTGEWIKTWGALAASNEAHGSWSTTGKFTEEDARRDVLDRCYETGASDCGVITTYFNQCIAAVGSGESGISIGKGKDESAAKSFALKECGKHGGGCVVKFSECTDPFFKKY
ncbi:DUF4189 domain-containing protein [Xanthomonas translucens pv. graminis]|uniref:DUF4189 domain-containing protein n=1 Tax=Xanthomonas graminis TaxID=3390026 RepID=UPI0025416589|nr:DUF4189 domain-containing protein [Xanthomonas translucens]WIH03645.1 DUF4189 domain-containing protein [Xanthomonas translucens pv. graminis]